MERCLCPPLTPASLPVRHRGTDRHASPFAPRRLLALAHGTALALVVAAAFCWLGLLGPWPWPLPILGALALVLVVVPWSRRFLLARFWVLFTRHRLQRAFWELRLHTRAGRLPLIPWITATPVGARALVICRAGMTFEDFEDSAPRSPRPAARVKPRHLLRALVVADLDRHHPP